MTSADMSYAWTPNTNLWASASQNTYMYSASTEQFPSGPDYVGQPTSGYINAAANNHESIIEI